MKKERRESVGGSYASPVRGNIALITERNVSNLEEGARRGHNTRYLAHACLTSRPAIWLTISAPSHGFFLIS